MPVIQIYASSFQTYPPSDKGRFATGARASRPQSRACARRAPILAFPHKGGNLSLAIRSWLRNLPPITPRHSRESGNPDGGRRRGRGGRLRVLPYSRLPAKSGIQKGSWRLRLFVRIRIYGIIGFSGFVWRVFGRRALARIRLGAISCYGKKRKPGETKSCKSRQSRKS